MMETFTDNAYRTLNSRRCSTSLDDYKQRLDPIMQDMEGVQIDLQEDNFTFLLSVQDRLQKLKNIVRKN